MRAIIVALVGLGLSVCGLGGAARAQPTAFRSGRAALTIDGSFRLGAFDSQKGLEYGVAELPALNGVRRGHALLRALYFLPHLLVFDQVSERALR
jgi:maltose-binding protein MalE